MMSNQFFLRGRERSIFKFEPLEQRTLLSAGVIDDLFGDDGQFLKDIAADMENVNDVVLQSDGKILLVGLRDTPNYERAGFIMRLNADGSLDTGFGDNGVVITVMDDANAGAIRADGKILVAGSGWQGGSSSNFAVVQLNADGSLDTSFGNGGLVYHDINGQTDYVENIVLTDNGGFVVVGRAINNFMKWDSAAIRCNADGSLDTSFSGDGKFTFDGGDNVGDQEYLTAAAIHEDGKLVLGGWTRKDGGGYLSFNLFRLNSNGSMDSTFGDDGMVRTEFNDDDGLLRDVAIQSDGKIVAVGDGSERTVIVRYNTDGSLDNGFAEGGIYRHTNTHGEGGDQALMLRADGTIVFAGTAQNKSGYSAGLLSSDGTLLESFTAVVGEEATDMNAVGFQPDGSLVLAGFRSPIDYYEYSNIHGWGHADDWHATKDVFATRLLLWDVPEVPEEDEVIPVDDDDDEETVDPTDEEENEEPINNDDDETIDPSDEEQEEEQTDDDEQAVDPVSDEGDGQSRLQPMVSAFSVKTINLFERRWFEDSSGNEEDELLELEFIEPAALT